MKRLLVALLASAVLACGGGNDSSSSSSSSSSTPTCGLNGQVCCSTTTACQSSLTCYGGYREPDSIQYEGTWLLQGFYGPGAKWPIQIPGDGSFPVTFCNDSGGYNVWGNISSSGAVTMNIQGTSPASENVDPVCIRGQQTITVQGTCGSTSACSIEFACGRQRGHKQQRLVLPYEAVATESVRARGLRLKSLQPAASRLHPEPRPGRKRPSRARPGHRRVRGMVRLRPRGEFPERGRGSSSVGPPESQPATMPSPSTTTQLSPRLLAVGTKGSWSHSSLPR